MTYKDTKKKAMRLNAVLFNADEFRLSWSKGSICDEMLLESTRTGKQFIHWGLRDYTRVECDRDGPFGKYAARVRVSIDSRLNRDVNAEIVVLSDSSKELEDWMKDTLMQEIAETLAPFYKWIDKAMVAAVGFNIAPRCHICLGTIKTGLPIIKCECGKTFHETCTKKKKECLNCGRLLSEQARME